MSMLETLGRSGQSSTGRTPIYRMSLAGMPLDVSVQEATMTSGENEHDSWTMTVSSTERTTTEGLLEAPISFLFGPSPRTETFCGYITSISEVQSSTGVLTWTMEILGPTKTMQGGAPRFWANRTIPSAVETLSYASYLGYTGHAHTYVWPALAQTDMSDWKTAVALADRLGWAVYNRYGVVGLFDPLQLFTSQGSSATLISETYVIAKTRTNEERTLLDFDPTEEAESSVAQMGLKVAYFNNDRVQVAFQKGTHSNYRFVNDFVIRDATEAALYVNGDDSDSSNWPQVAKARIMGNASLYPGMTVEVLTTSRAYYSGKFNGRWLVRAVHHKMDRQSFQSNLVLARPDGKTQVFDGPPLSFWQTAAKARPVLTLSSTMTLPTPSDNIGYNPFTEAGIWVSSWTNSTVRSVS